MDGKKITKDLEPDKNLFPYLTLRTAVTAEYFFEAKTAEDLQKAKRLSLTDKMPLTVIGGGSNIAVLGRRIKGLVVKNSYIKKQVIDETDSSADLMVSSGYPVSKLVNETVEAGISGFEYHRGLPGTAGGAIYMNAKWTRPPAYFGDNLISARLLDDKGMIRTVDRNYFRFAYDYSYLQETKEILLDAIFRLKKENPEILKKRADEALSYRKKTQPFGVATCGCFFQNVDGKSAGYLIDQAGLKGFAVGDFVVSDIHANFIINRGKGKSEDLMKLLGIIKNRVKEKFGIELKEEVVII